MSFYLTSCGFNGLHHVFYQLYHCFSTILSHVSYVYLLFLLLFLQFFCRPKVRRAASKSLTRLGDGIAPEILAIIRSVEDTVDQAIG